MPSDPSVLTSVTLQVVVLSSGAPYKSNKPKTALPSGLLTKYVFDVIFSVIPAVYKTHGN